MALSMILRVFFGRKPPAPVTPPSTKIFAPRRDAPEESTPRPDRLGRLSGVTITIEYADASGGESCRTVTIHAIERASNGIIYLNAFCHLRGAPRCFRFERIRSVIDDATGEVVEPPDRFFRERGFEIESASDATDALLAKFAAPLQLMVYTARIDGAFSIVERRIILDYLGERSRKPLDEAKIDRFLDLQHPERTAFLAALIEVNGWKPHSRRFITDAITAIMHADGVQSPEEIDLINELQASLTPRRKPKATTRKIVTA